jgi:ubiquinone/menaquinone biosynthesis C-methylase UbiE
MCSALDKTSSSELDRQGVAVQQADIRIQWERAAPGWAHWEATVSAWMAPATESMLAMAGVDTGAQVLDLACGAGSQTWQAARRVGAQGQVVASDMADMMLHHVREHVQAAGLTNVTTLAGAAENLDVAPESVDAVICPLGLLRVVDPAKALLVVRRALRPGGKVAGVVFTTPAQNPLMAKPMPILLRHAGKTAAEALAMMQEAFGAYRAVVSDGPEAVRVAAWAAVAETLRTFETPSGFVAPAEVLVAAGVKPV